MGQEEPVKFFQWECQSVDGVDLVVLQDGKSSIKHLEYQQPQGITYKFLLDFPEGHEFGVIVKQLKGRGEISIYQQPTSENNFTTKIKVDDGPYNGADAYAFELYFVKTIELEKYQTYPPRRPEEKALLATGISPKDMEAYLVGHAHIDLSWLWPKSETIHEVGPNTFRDVLDLMDKYPMLHFSQSSAQMYLWMEQHYPELFERIRQRIADGRWEIMGGSWCEHNSNLLDGESLVRQYLYGKRYFKEKFGVDVRIGWLPDVFGFAWTIPQIYKKAGIDFFLTFKLKWQIERMQPPIPFPYYNFWWTAPDGSTVLACHTVGSYSESVHGNEIADHMRRLIEKHGLSTLIVPFGYGDHGGGPSQDMIERGLALQKREDFPRIRFLTAQSYFDAVANQTDQLELPTVCDELYVKTHRGTHTTESKVKRGNQKGECLLMSAEKLAVLASQHGADYPRKKLDNAWRLLLFGQVHDNMDGTSIRQVYIEAAEDYAAIQQAGDEVIVASMNALGKSLNTSGEGDPIIVFNPLSWARSGVVELPLDTDDFLEILNPDGDVLPSQITECEGDTRSLIFVAQDIPATGYFVYRIRKASGGEAKSATDLSVEDYVLENASYRVELNPDTGCIASIFDKQNSVEVLDGSKCGNLLRIYEDEPPNPPAGEPAWNIYLGDATDIEYADSVKVIEYGPVRATIRVEKHFGDSRFVQDIRLYADLLWLEFAMSADWHEHYKFAKAVFPLSFENTWATYEIPYGAIQRYDYKLADGPKQEIRLPNRPWEEADSAKFEVAALKWVDLERPDGSYGVSLLNDCKYGHSISGNEIELSLLRGPSRGYEGMELSWADQSDDAIVGIHKICYALYPHYGGWQDAGTVHRGYEFNYPLMARRTSSHPGNLPASNSFLSLSPTNVICSAIKQAEDGNEIILRMYESVGKDTEAHVKPGAIPSSATLTDLLEWGEYVEEKPLQIEEDTIIVNIKAFEIVTVRVKF